MIQALLVVGLSFFNPQVPTDSLGIQTIDGKVFILHKVEEKETLYSLSRRYGVSVDDIIVYNPSAKTTLDIGQVLKIPFVKKQPELQTAGKTHTVAEKETLYSISRQYGVTIAELKSWNNLTGNDLSLGQVLVIGKPGKTAIQTVSPVVGNAKGTHTVMEKETLYSISKKYGVTVDDLKKWNDLEGNELSLGQVLVVSQTTNTIRPSETQPVATTTKVEVTNTTENTTQSVHTPVNTTTQPSTTTETIKITEGPANSDEISESGLAELIEGTEGNRKYLALHRTAPIGTILKVRNEMNNREVFVRVMGKLPDTALTDKLVIKVSRSAYDRLGAIDQRFRVEVTYYK